jgi:hypothetical protein
MKDKVRKVTFGVGNSLDNFIACNPFKNGGVVVRDESLARSRSITFRVLLVLTIAAAGLGSSCKETPVSARDTSAMTEISVNGTVRFVGLEGGFWAVRGDDNVTYDPRGGLSKDFQHDGLRVHLVARELRDVAGIHMVGPIVEIVSIRRLP